MISKIIFTLAMVCVVNASVLTASDDEPEIEVASYPKRCELRSCERLCRRLKFPGGTCVNGRCKCDNFLNVEDDLDTEFEENPKRCHDRACDWVCRRLNHTSGSCVDERCKCENFLNAEEKPTDLDDLVSLTADLETEIEASSIRCRNKVCDWLCRLNNSSGSCVDGRCKCDRDSNADKKSTDLGDLVSMTADVETEFEENPKRCHDRACDWVCRRLNHTSGSCVDGRCKCENSLNAEEKQTDLEDLVSLTADVEIEFEENPKRCHDRACDWVCRRLNHTSGSCVDGRYKCENSLNAEEKQTDLEDLVSLTAEVEIEFEENPKRCHDRVCDWVCRRLNHTSGSCVDGRCMCENSLNAKEKPTDLEDIVFLTDTVTESNVGDSFPTKACNNKKCDQLCRKKKFRGGACLGPNCYCNKFLSALDDDVSEESLPVSELSEDPTKRRCDSRACYQLCRRLKLPGGVCVNGRCKCDNFFRTEEDAVDEYPELDERRVCRLPKCNRTCARRGYEGATCVKNRCKCYNISKTPVSELSEDPTERTCNTQSCDKLCRRLKFSGGSCVNGRCRCNNFFGAEDAIEEYSELATRRGCNLKKCNRTCARRGYAGARCENGWCNCYDKIPREDPSKLNDVASDEIEESNVILTNEDKVTAPALRACNTVNCNQMCHRLNYAGGWCRFGQCQCY